MRVFSVLKHAFFSDFMHFFLIFKVYQYDLFFSRKTTLQTVSRDFTRSSDILLNSLFTFLFNFLFIFKVHGAGCPAGRAGLQKDDAIILVNEKDVISLKHNEFVQLIKSLSVMKLTMVVERFVHSYFIIVVF